MDELRELVDAGFCRLYSSQDSAEPALGGRCYPAPLGDVVKLGPGGRRSAASFKIFVATT